MMKYCYTLITSSDPNILTSTKGSDYLLKYFLQFISKSIICVYIVESWVSLFEMFQSQGDYITMQGLLS